MCCDFDNLKYFIIEEKDFFNLPIIVNKGVDVLPKLSNIMQEYINLINNCKYLKPFHKELALNTTNLLKKQLMLIIKGILTKQIVIL
jgi:hypothetical protein